MDTSQIRKTIFEYIKKEYSDIEPISTSEDLDCNIEKKCECGSEKCKFPIHSDWCPKYTK